MPGMSRYAPTGPLPSPTTIGLVRLETVHAEKAVLLRVNGDGAKPEFRGRANDADGDLAAVGDEQFSIKSAYGLN
jgi:hypothetical protein